jgi:hypothetical protein
LTQIRPRLEASSRSILVEIKDIVDHGKEAVQNKVLQVLLALKFIDFIKLGTIGIMMEDTKYTSNKQIQESTNIVEDATLLIINKNLQ